MRYKWIVYVGLVVIVKLIVKLGGQGRKLKEERNSFFVKFVVEPDRKRGRKI